MKICIAGAGAAAESHEACVVHAKERRGGGSCGRGSDNEERCGSGRARGVGDGEERVWRSGADADIRSAVVEERVCKGAAVPF